MQQISQQIYSFDGFMLDLSRGCLFGSNRQEIKLRPKSRKTLELFPSYHLISLGPIYEQKGMQDEAIDGYLQTEERWGLPGASVTKLQRAYDGRQMFLMFIKVDPVWTSLRADPRFTALLQRLHLN